MPTPLLERLLSIGVGPWLTDEQRQHVRFLNGAFGLATLIGVVFGTGALLLLDVRTADWGPFVGLVIGGLTLWLQHKRRYLVAQNVAYLGSMLFVSAATLVMPETAGIRIYLIVLGLASFLLPRSRREQDLYYIISCVLFVGMEWLTMGSYYTVVHAAMACGIIYVIGSVFRHVHAAALASLTERDAAIRAQNVRLTDLNAMLHVALRTSEEQKHALDEMNTVKDRVVSVLSHDLRSPLVSLDGMLAAYEEGMFAPEDLAELVPETRHSIACMQEQLEDVLTWARILLNGSDPRAQTVLADAAGRTVVHTLRQATAKGVTLSVNIEPELVVAAEGASVLLLLRNLLANAIKFTPEGGTVTVTAEAVGEGAVLRVHDTGVGISPDRLADLNDGAGAHTTTLGTHGEKGSGLGLTLCREVAGHFGGQLYVESAKDEGTTATVVFPAAEAVPESAAV